MGIETGSTGFSKLPMSRRFAAAKLALPETVHKSMFKLLNTAITRGPDPLPPGRVLLQRPVFDDPELGSFCINKIEYIGINSLIVGDLWLISIGFVWRFLDDRAAPAACRSMIPG